jgi:hypothetical protein
MATLHDDLVKLAQEHPETRVHLLPLLKRHAAGDTIATDATPEMEYVKYKSWIMHAATTDIPKFLKEHEESFHRSLKTDKAKSSWSRYIGELRTLESALDKAIKEFIGESPDFK